MKKGIKIKEKIIGKKYVEEGECFFWNIAANKDKDFWNFIGKFDFISMCETWVEEEGWLRLKRLLPKSHNWSCSPAERDKKKEGLREVLS